MRLFQISLFRILAYCGLLKRAELRGVKWTTKLQKLTWCCYWNHIMKSQKSSVLLKSSLFQKWIFSPFLLSFVFHTEMWEITLKINALWSLFSIFCKNWKNIFKLWGLSEIYIIDNRWSVLNRQIGDGKMCMQNSENEWVVCLRLRGYNMTTVLSLCIWPLS